MGCRRSEEYDETQVEDIRPWGHRMGKRYGGRGVAGDEIVLL